MNRYKLSKAGISVAEGIKRLNGNAELYESLLYKFSSDENYKNLSDAIENKDVEKAFFYAHSLKSLAGNLSMNGLFDSIVPLVELFRSGSLENAETLFESVSCEYNKIISVLRES